MKALLIIAALAAALGGCAQRLIPYAAYTTTSVPLEGARPGDIVLTTPFSVNGKPVTAISLVRAFSQDGKLGVCGSTVLVGNAWVRKTVDEQFAATNAALTLGDPAAGGAVGVKPSFMPRYGIEGDALTVRADAIDFTAYPGKCILTERRWSDGFQRYARLQAPMPAR